MKLLIFALIIVFLTIGPTISAKKKKKTAKEWNAIENLRDDLLDSESKNEISLLGEIEQIEKKRKQKGFQDKDTGPMILFVDLIPQDEGRRDWTLDEMRQLAGVWQSLLQTASLVSEMRVFSENQLLVKILHGWMIHDIQKFLLKQPETYKILRDKKDIFPGDMNLDDDDDWNCMKTSYPTAKFYCLCYTTWIFYFDELSLFVNFLAKLN